MLRHQIIQGSGSLPLNSKANTFGATNERGRLYQTQNSRFDDFERESGRFLIIPYFSAPEKRLDHGFHPK
jgi:hypothetical protein